MIRRGQALLIAAALMALLSKHATASGILSGDSSPLCLVPVKNGEPTKDDFNQSFRMTSKVVVVPGLDRPIIFPWNRHGIWTIDADGAFVPFGGEFPNQYLNEYASDTSTGDVIGVSWELGVFRIRPGSAQFERLYAADGKPFVHPFSAVYVARLGGTVISDNSGLYLFHSSGRAEPLYWDSQVGGKRPGRVFDLPALTLLLVTGNEGRIYSRSDDGTLAPFDTGLGGIEAARVTADGTIFLGRLEEKNYIVPWPPKDKTRPPAQQGVNTSETFDGDMMYADRLVKFHGKEMDVYLPSQVWNPPKEFPGGPMVANANRDGLYTLNEEKKWDLVDQSREVASNLVGLFELPTEQHALLVNGKDRLFLLVRKTDGRAAACLR